MCGNILGNIYIFIYLFLLNLRIAGQLIKEAVSCQSSHLPDHLRHQILESVQGDS
jgi:hypothetical protein